MENPKIMVSCEDPSTTYLCAFGEYAGWYRP